MSAGTAPRLHSPNAEMGVTLTPVRGRRIIVSVPTGFQLRQFIHSGVVARLTDLGCRVLIASPNTSGSAFTDIGTNSNVSFHALNPRMRQLTRKYFVARQHFLLRHDLSETLRHKLKGLKKSNPLLAILVVMARTIMSRLPALRRRVLELEHLLLRDGATDRLIRSERPDLVLLGSPGYVPQDAILLHTAKKYQVRTVTAVLSWDNLSSKGLINPQPDRLLVWSEHMKREVVELHGFDDWRIFETGAIVHDAFAAASELGSRADNFKRLGLDLNRKLIFYGTNHGGLFPDEFQVVRQVALWVEKDELGLPAQLWIRLHPQAVTGPFAVDTAKYLDLQSERVHIELPPVQKSEMLWELPKGDLEHLIRMIRDADVVINAGSTISIDAAVLDRPVVCVAYDAAPDVSPHKSIQRIYSFNHLAHIVRAGGVRVAFAPNELRKHISDYVQDSALDREGRRRVVEQQFGRVDGRSGERTVEAIIQMLGDCRLPVEKSHTHVSRA